MTTALADVAEQITKDCDAIMSRLFVLYDIGKALPHPYNAIGDEASSLLHDFPSMSSRIRAYVKATEADAACGNNPTTREVGISPQEES